MIALSVNSVLFAAFDLPTACRYISLAGFDGIEISVIQTQRDHIGLTGEWRSRVGEIRGLANDHGLRITSLELGDDPELLPVALEAASELGASVVAAGGGGGTTGNDADLQRAIDSAGAAAELGARFEVVVVYKAHVGNAVHNTDTLLALASGVDSRWFGLNYDPSHILRAGERPEQGIGRLIGQVRHVHIRDCPPVTDGQTGGRPREAVLWARRWHRSARLLRRSGRGRVPGYAGRGGDRRRRKRRVPRPGTQLHHRGGKLRLPECDAHCVGRPGWCIRGDRTVAARFSFLTRAAPPGSVSP